MENEIKKILDEKLKGNDVNISDMIISYLKKRCFICWHLYMEDVLKKSYCNEKPYPQLYMNVCKRCINEFKFKKCYKCHIYIDISRCYIIGSLDYYSCQYCVHKEGYLGWV